MYIPSPHGPPRGSSAQAPAVHPHAPGLDPGFFAFIHRLLLSTLGFLFDFANDARQGLARRQFSSDPGKNQGIKIGLIVALTVSAFLAAVIAFLWVYGRSIRFTERKRRRGRRHKFSSSRSSTRSDGSGPLPAPKGGPPPGPSGDGPPPKDPPKD